MKNKTESIWVLIPAGGLGKRMTIDCPKQYLPLFGKPVLHHVLQQFCDNDCIQSVALGLRDEDTYWPQYQFSHDKLYGFFSAGAERMDTVLNGLDYLLNQTQAQEDDWVMVHDAARPLISQAEISLVVDLLQTTGIGVVLGHPVTDTLKRVSKENTIEQSVDRAAYWRALTPQTFRINVLKQALQQAKAKDLSVTDESMAIEQAGYSPIMVEGDATNIKLTHANDLALAEFYLSQQ